MDERAWWFRRRHNLITFAVAGPGAMVAVDNGDIGSHETFQGNVRSAFQGRCIAIVRASGPGRIGITGSATSLRAGAVGLEAR